MNIDQFLAILRARYKIGLFALAVTVLTTIAITLVMPKTYKAGADVVVDLKNGDMVAGAPVLMGGMMMQALIATHVDILKSRRVALKVVDKLKMVQDPEVQRKFREETGGEGDMRTWLAELVAKNFDVEPGRDSSVIHLVYSGSTAQFAALMANEFAQAAIDTNLELKVQPAREASAWFEQQIKLLRGKLEDAQTKLSAFQREKGITSVDERLDVENARFNELSSQLVAAQAHTYEGQARLQQARQALERSPDVAAGDLATLPDVLANPLVQGLKADLSRQEAKLQDISSQLGTKHPQYQKLKAEIDGLRQKIRDEVANIPQAIEKSSRLVQSRERDIQSALAAQKTKLLQLKQQRDEVSVLAREVDIAQRAFDGAMQRMTQLSLESRANQTNLLLLESAVAPRTPASPKPVLNVVLAVVLGTLLGVGLIMLLEIVDLRIRTEEALQRGLGLPVLGSIGPDAPQRDGFWPRTARQLTRLLGIERSQVSYG